MKFVSKYELILLSYYGFCELISSPRICIFPDVSLFKPGVFIREIFLLIRLEQIVDRSEQGIEVHLKTKYICYVYINYKYTNI